MRLPYGRDTAPTESFNFEEDVDGTDHSKYLWGNAAYAFACRLTEAFAKYSWCAAIVQMLLDKCISTYVTTDDSASQEAKATRPFREARIDVMEVLGKPGRTRRWRSCGRTSSSTS